MKSKIQTERRMVKLESVVAEAVTGFACGRRADDGVIQIRMNNVTRRGELDWSNVLRVPSENTDLKSFALQPGDVLFNNTNSTEMVGKTAHFDAFNEPVVFSNHFTRLRADTAKLHPDYLALWLHKNFLDGLFAKICDRWIGQSAVQRTKLLGLEIALPPVDEQRRIAGRLREQMAAVERARAAVEQQLDAAQKLPAALLRAVFTSPAAQRWPRRKLGEVANVVNGFGFSEYFQGRTDLPFPFVKVSDMNADGAEEIVSRAANTVDDSILKQLGAKTYSAGTVIFPKVGGALLTNKKRVLGVEATFDNNVMGVVPKEAESEWIYRWVLTIDLKTLANTQALPSIRQSDIAALEIPMPPKSERQQLCKRLETELAAARSLCESLSARLAEIELLPAALLRDAFGGNTN